MPLFFSNPQCAPQTFTVSQGSKISLSEMGLPSPQKAAVLCLQSLSRSPDERQGRATGIITKTGVAFDPKSATCTSSFFRDDLHMPVTGFPGSLVTLGTMLLRWRPSGVADFSILSSVNFSITCSDISLVLFCVYSMSPGQFMNLFLAFSPSNHLGNYRIKLGEQKNPS